MKNVYGIAGDTPGVPRVRGELPAGAENMVGIPLRGVVSETGFGVHPVVCWQSNDSGAWRPEQKDDGE